MPQNLTEGREIETMDILRIFI